MSENILPNKRLCLQIRQITITTMKFPKCGLTPSETVETPVTSIHLFTVCFGLKFDHTHNTISCIESVERLKCYMLVMTNEYRKLTTEKLKSSRLLSSYYLISLPLTSLPNKISKYEVNDLTKTR